MSFPVAKFRFQFRVTTEVYLPDYSGSTFRGAFGNALKRAVCIRNDRDCQNCQIRDHCVYLWLFETPTPAKALFLKNSSAAPHPFVFEPDIDSHQGVLPAGELFYLDVILFGKGIDYLAYFAYAFDRMGKYGLGKNRGKSELMDILDLFSDEKKSIFKAKEKILLGSLTKKESDNLMLIPPEENRKRVTLEFLTPIRIKRKGHYVSKLAFEDLITTLLRRIFLLNHYHGDGKGDIDHLHFIELAKKIKTRVDQTRWYEWQRYSHRQRTKMALGGLIGRVEYEGPLRDFMPILRLGENIHVGKNTSFGLGKYRILQ